MHFDVTVRRASLDDADALVTLASEFYAADGHRYDEALVRGALDPLLRNDEYGVAWLAGDPDASAGYAVVTWGYSLEAGGREAVLDEIYVRRRRQGVGDRLLQFVVDDCRRRGLARLYLETEAGNDEARRFYVRHGFTVESSIWLSLPL